MRCRRSELAAGVLVVLFAFEASAAVRRFALATDASNNGEGEIEVEGWLDFGRPANHKHETDRRVTNAMFWLGARLGLLDSLELASFLVLEKLSYIAPHNPSEVVAEEQSGIMMWVTDLKWRPFEVGKLPADVFVQFELVHWFELYHPTQFRFTLGISKTLGRFLFAFNYSRWESVVGPPQPGVDMNGNVITAPTLWEWNEFELAASVNLVESEGSIPSVNLGVEYWAFFAQPGHVHNHLLHGGGMVVGPTLALSRGRLWLTLHLGFPFFGVHFGENVDRTPRFMFEEQLVGRAMLGINI
jgi:hypothetical protein